MLHGKSDPSKNLVGGYYDVGDAIKFNFPQSFAMTMLSWSVIEYSAKYEAAWELNHIKDVIKWGTDYLLKTFNSSADTINCLVTQSNNKIDHKEGYKVPSVSMVPNFIGGKFVESLSSTSTDVINPGTQEVVSQVHVTTTYSICSKTCLAVMAKYATYSSSTCYVQISRTYSKRHFEVGDHDIDEPMPKLKLISESSRTVGLRKDEDNISGPMGGVTMKSVVEEERDEAHLTVLLNNTEVEPYVM
ncbi:hypothetical protein POM88_017358 [Heracleum sosnowskyi]|uniref:cellulase n=1 Tax=Heracleum sosnowskyi TaxID=360622 RepID=A0AAD8IP23_9APIA|nr:hypothetical protein POM88_017358 [Heracleum sosnowskyi]